MKKYNIIYADPPWRYNDRKCNGACEAHYKTMKIFDICKLPVQHIAAENSAFFVGNIPNATGSNDAYKCLGIQI